MNGCVYGLAGEDEVLSRVPNRARLLIAGRRLNYTWLGLLLTMGLAFMTGCTSAGSSDGGGGSGYVSPADEDEAGSPASRSLGGLLSPASVGCLHLVIIDEGTIDKSISSIEAAANSHGVEAEFLVNDDMPIEVGNPPLRWNQLFPGDLVWLPGGQVDDEGIFALPPNPPFSVDDYVAGIVPQSQLDEIPDVMPLGDLELVQLIGRSCVAVVYDSDIGINVEPLLANLQGARYGLFFFTVLEVRPPGTLPESGSDSSLFELLIRVEPVPEDFCLGDDDCDDDDDEKCDDNDVCTDDSCDPDLGCVHVFNTDPCDDGDVCTENDTCTSGVCVGTPVECGPVQECDPADGLCKCGDCPFDMNENGAIDSGDLAAFLGCFATLVGPDDLCFCSDVNSNGGIDTGDFAAFLDCFVGFCPCPVGGSPLTAARGATSRLSIEPVVSLSGEAPDYADSLPASVGSVTTGSTFFVHVWASRGDLPVAGLACVFVDCAFDWIHDPQFLEPLNVETSAGFAMLRVGFTESTDGVVRNVGGCVGPDQRNLAVSERWARVATVKMRAGWNPGTASVALAAPSDPFRGTSIVGSAQHRGLSRSRVEFGETSFEVVSQAGGSRWCPKPESP